MYYGKSLVAKWQKKILYKKSVCTVIYIIIIIEK